MIHIELISALSDNYIYLLHNDKENITSVIDPGEADPVTRVLKDKNWNLDQIINTHHHNDHTGGNVELKKQWGSQLIAPSYEKDRISNVDIFVSHDDIISIAGVDAKVIHTPGHTLGHVCFYMPEQKCLFSGDTMFYLGCGRVFEGTMEQMWDSLLKLKSLPDDTLVYCGHEYTLSNAKFSTYIDPNNQLLKQTCAEINNKREKELPTIPFLLGKEKKINPFLRADESSFNTSIGLNINNPTESFRKMRLQKDNF
tara:strand:- start:30 stop:794 length:765 start_codon:yes stop_codon:yes gene_type:complete